MDAKAIEKTTGRGHGPITRAAHALDGWRTALVERKNKFSKDEDGSFIVFSLFIMIMIIMICGMAVDLMRFETRRTALQNTIDAAVLSAADTDQLADPETVVKDFVEKSGFDPDDVVVTVGEERLGDLADGELLGRDVTAETNIKVNNFFMDMLGIYHLQTPATSSAIEGVQNVEISLVVDISGSMGGSRMTNLKSAAKEFFDTVITLDNNGVANGNTSISIVPYNANVVVPDALLDRLNTSGAVLIDESDVHWRGEDDGALTSYQRTSPESKCVRFYDDDDRSSDDIPSEWNTMTTNDLQADYESMRAITSTQELDRLQFFDESSKSSSAPWNNSWQYIQASSGNYGRPAADWNRFCDPTRAPILIHETDPNVLDAHIDSLSTGGWTSVDVGMKWGVALLDPAMRPIINNMVDADILSDDVENRPDEFGNTQSLKVVVLMTDGANTIQKDVRQAFKNGPSNIWYSESTAMASGNWHDGYFVETPDTAADEGDDFFWWFQPRNFGNRSDGIYWHRNNLPADAEQLDYVTLYNRFSERGVRDIFRDNKNNGNSIHRFDDDNLDAMYSAHNTAVYDIENQSSLDERLFGSDDSADGLSDSVYGICDAAKVNNEILVFTVAFEAPNGGKNAMRKCATLPSYYYDVAGTDITEAFQSIAGAITTLRLTQ